MSDDKSECGGVEGHAWEPKGILSRWNARTGGDSGSDRGRGRSIPSSGQQSSLNSPVPTRSRTAGIKPGPHSLMSSQEFTDELINACWWAVAIGFWFRVVWG